MSEQDEVGGPPPEIRTYTLQEAAEMMSGGGRGVSLRALQEGCRKGTIKGVKVGSTWRISHANLVAFVNGEVLTPPRLAAAGDGSAPAPAPASPRPAAGPGEAPRETGEPAPLIEHFPSGRVRSRCEVVRDEAGEIVRHGGYEAFHENGRRAARGSFDHGRLQGAWEQWHDNGRLHVSGGHRDGLAEGLWTYWSADGDKIQEGGMRRGRTHGAWKQWHPGGQPWCEGAYEDGEPVGTWRYWDADGRPLT